MMSSSKQSHVVRLPSYLMLLLFMVFFSYAGGSIYWIIKKDNEVEKFRRLELDLQNQIKERDLNLQQYRQHIEQLERRVEIFDAVRELSHASVPTLTQKKIAQVVDETGQRFGMDPYFILALMSAESSMRPSVNSHKGAHGLMQIMPTTGESLAEWVKDEPRLIGLKDGEQLPTLTIEDVESNIQLGVLYLTHLMVKFENVEDAIYAYNLGPTLLEKRKQEGGQLPVKYYQKVINKYRELTQSRFPDNPKTNIIALSSPFALFK